MPLTKEQLLQKRFKFIMPYPGSHWEVGDIFEHINNDIYVVSHYPVKMLGVILETYPHIFQPLPWWSDRGINDLPEYVKRIDSGVVYSLKVDYAEKSMWLDSYEFTLNLNKYEPATFEDRVAYINQKQQ